ncbi:MAG: galactitol-1-phosphate 5-dehydrogenase [Chloroflexi bacterium]|nr:galactitol-1-phosphate 5-dehydrogenase [Chloroflexota bacterium]
MISKGEVFVAEPTMKALVLHAVGDLRLEEVPRPRPAPGEALVRVAAVGVCGSDVPRVYEHGTYRYPLIPGHEVAGVVEAVNGAPLSYVGERVTIKPLIPCRACRYCQIGAYGQCESYDYLGSRRDGAFAEYVCAPVQNLVRLPKEADLVEAALTEPAAVALHAVRQGGIQPGDCVAVLGAGPIGMMVAQWARIWGAGKILLVDIDERKLQLAQRLWLGETWNAREGDPVGWAWEQTLGFGVDFVVEASGASVTLEQAVGMARPLGRVVILGNPSGDVILPQKTASQILRKQLVLVGTWNSQFTALPVDEWRVTVEMIAGRRLDVRSLISHRLPLTEGVEALAMMHERRAFYSRVVFLPHGEGGLA